MMYGWLKSLCFANFVVKTAEELQQVLIDALAKLRTLKSWILEYVETVWKTMDITDKVIKRISEYKQ